MICKRKDKGNGIEGANVVRLCRGFPDLSDRSPSTNAVYRRAIEGFIAWSGSMAVTHGMARVFRDSLIARGLTPSTACFYLAALQQYFDYLIQQEVVSINPFQGIKRPRMPRRHARGALTKEEARALLHCIPRLNVMGLRDYAIVNLMLRTALRE